METKETPKMVADWQRREAERERQQYRRTNIRLLILLVAIVVAMLLGLQYVAESNKSADVKLKAQAESNQ